MNDDVRQQYLAAEVMTAPPQKLQLLLVEGALRFALRARRLLLETAGAPEAHEQACHELSRAQEIMVELVAGLNAQIDRPLVRRVAAVYLFIHRSLVAAQVNRDPAVLGEAISVLEVERDTWRELCTRLTQPGPPPPAGSPWNPSPSGSSFVA